MLGDFARDTRNVHGFLHEDISVGVEEVNERAFLFGEKHGPDAHHFALRATRVYEDLLDALCGLKGSGQPLGVRCLLGGPLPDDRELL